METHPEPEQTGKKELTGTFEVALSAAKEATDTYWNELLDAFQAEYPDLRSSASSAPVIGDEIVRAGGQHPARPDLPAGRFGFRSEPADR